MNILSISFAGLLFSCCPLAYSAGSCELSAAEIKANASLSFTEFDQQGTLPGTARALSERGCYMQAVVASEQYLVSGVTLSTRERSIVIWHMAQNLALAGNEREAARLSLAALREADATDQADQFDWNSYVRGSWGFWVKDANLLAQSQQKLIATGGGRNLMNAKVLAALQACLSRSYAFAYEAKSCREPASAAK